MTLKNEMIVLFIVILLLSPGCNFRKAESRSGSSVLAEVNGVPITEDDRYLLLEGGHAGRTAPAMKEQALEDLIDQELLYQEGLRLGLDRDFKFRNEVKIMEMRLKEFKHAEIARRVMSTEVAATVTVSNDDVDRYVAENAEVLKNEFRLGVLRFTEETEAEEVRARIETGTPFETVAHERFHGPMNITMGRAPWDLGYLRSYQIPSLWRETIIKLAKGEVSTVLKGKEGGYAIFKLIDRRKDPGTDFGSMRAGIMNRIQEEKLAKTYDAYLDKLRSRATIRILERGKSLNK